MSMGSFPMGSSPMGGGIKRMITHFVSVALYGLGSLIGAGGFLIKGVGLFIGTGKLITLGVISSFGSAILLGVGHLITLIGVGRIVKSLRVKSFITKVARLKSFIK